MADLTKFENQVLQQLSSANREPHWTLDEHGRYMAEVGERRQRFEQIAARLGDKVIRPYVQALAKHFDNASLSKGEPTGRCTCWFGYCERFPATTQVVFLVEQDARYEKVAVCYEARMMPTFIKFDEYDRLTLRLDQVNETAVADWVEERLLEFLDAYLRIDRGSEEFEQDTATDPVCGMRISRSDAAATADHCGHPYYFCSTECRDKFTGNPTAYVRVKAM